MLYQTPTESYGVDGELIPFKDSDRWDEKVYHVDPSIYNNTYRIDVLVFHNPHNRLMEDIQIIAEIAKAVYELYQKVFGSSGDTAGTGDNGDYTFDAGNHSYLYGTYKQNLTTSVKPVGTFTSLQTINGNYLTVVNGGGKLTDVIHSDATVIGPWEKFKLVPISGNQYALQTINGNYLTVVNGGGKLTDVIHSDATVIGPWEKFLSSFL